jgi:NADP-dependent 3-hydroxy acid dehydrogenase YdfG
MAEQTRQVALVTGATSGIGLEIATKRWQAGVACRPGHWLAIEYNSE